MAFKRSVRKTTRYATPGELYRDLPQRTGAVQGLWAHQAEMLKAYTDKANHPDIALELPTGTGKTLIGLLIAEWNRRYHNQRVLYACPTRQLAEQVYVSANREGIDTTLLTGSHVKWDPLSRMHYESAQRVGITTYSSIFNSHPKLADPSVMLFDDAHAGEQYVGEAYSLSLNRYNDTNEYQRTLEVISPAVDKVFLERLKTDQSDPAITSEVRLVVPLRQAGMVKELTKTLSTLREPHSYRYSMIHRGIASCLIYVSYSEILIRPYIPPTNQNSLFTQARQRIYLSATLGDGGELERAFGRHTIERLHQLDDNTAPRSGRRFFVFPEFAPNSKEEAAELSKAIVTQAGKALILSQSNEVAMKDAKELAQDGWRTFGIDDVSTSMQTFIDAEHAVCALAARYDGLDLPGDACRLIVFDGTPDQLNLQERFLQQNVQAGVALETRIRTRIVQGSGRCTRGPKDTAVVLIKGELSHYLTRPETRLPLSPELQAEILFGLENSQDRTREDILENTRAFLSQDTDDTWRSDAEPILTDYRREAVQSPSPGSYYLSACVDKEIDAWNSASVSSWRDAANSAHSVCNTLGNGGKATRQYQAFWKYLEAAWTDMAAEQSGDSLLKSISRNLLSEASSMAGRCLWINQMAQFPETEAPTMSQADNVAISTIVAILRGDLKENRHRDKLIRMRDEISQRDAGRFEAGLTTLGRMLGADASKPTRQGRCDSTWCWDNELWLALEAKSEHNTAGTLSIKDVRQSNGQLQLLADDRNCSTTPPDSAVVIISPKPGVHSDAITIAHNDVYLAHPDTIRTIAADTENAWKRLLTGISGMSAEDLHTLVAQTLRGFELLPSDIRNRLTRNPIGQTKVIPED